MGDEDSANGIGLDSAHRSFENTDTAKGTLAPPVVLRRLYPTALTIQRQESAAVTPSLPMLTAEQEERLRSDLAGGGLSTNTRRNYESAWRRFAAYCTRVDASALPAHGLTVAAYLDASDDVGIGSLQVHLAAIRWVHRQCSHGDPMDPTAQRLWKALRKRRPYEPQGADAVGMDQLRKIVAALNGPAGVHDRAVLLLGFTGALRRSELAGLRLRDVALLQGDQLRLTIWNAKTAKTGEPQHVRVGATGTELCPVAAVRAWISLLAASELSTAPDAPLFRRFTRSKPTEHGLTGHRVNAILHAAAQAVGLDYSAHALRVGAITTLDSLGWSAGEIKLHTRHKGVRMVDHYTRHDEQVGADMARALGGGVGGEGTGRGKR